MYGTLHELLGANSFVLVCFLAATAVTAWLAVKGRLRYYTAILGLMTAIALVTRGAVSVGCQDRRRR